MKTDDAKCLSDALKSLSREELEELATGSLAAIFYDDQSDDKNEHGFDFDKWEEYAGRGLDPRDEFADLVDHLPKSVADVVDPEEDEDDD